MRMKMSPRRDGGFTLIEIMVVITIIAALIGAGSLMINVAQKKRMLNETEMRMNSLVSALAMLQSANELGRYPPTDITKLVYQGFDGKKFGTPPNDTNIGIETLYIVFRLPGISSDATPKGLDDEEKISNTDDDKANAMLGNMKKPDLFEYADAWGRPLVYINANDYKDPSKVDKYKLPTGEEVKVEPKKNEKTGEFLKPDSFQLISLGPDGLPNTDDDIVK